MLPLITVVTLPPEQGVRGVTVARSCSLDGGYLHGLTRLGRRNNLLPG
jgi:hypothetical protein